MLCLVLSVEFVRSMLSFLRVVSDAVSSCDLVYLLDSAPLARLGDNSSM